MTEKYKARIEIAMYIKQCGYTYSVDDVIEGYNKRNNNFYNSYTMDDCIDNCIEYLKVLV